jgi:hypothetical protein
MRAKKTKVYTLSEVGKILGFSGRSIRDFVQVGLIHAFPNPTWKVVTEEELKRIMREGLDTSDVTARLAAKRKAAGKTAKKRAKRGAAAPKPAKKKSAYARKVTKKQVKRNATAAGAAAKKKPSKKRAATATRNATKKKQKRS